MRNRLYIVMTGWLVVMVFATVYHITSGCGSSSPTTPAQVPVSIEGLNGKTEITTDSSFKYTFPKPVNIPTVTASTFYMVEGTTCDAVSAIAATISCGNTECVLTPSGVLVSGTIYTICLTTDIKYSDGTSFAGVTAEFTTAGSATISSVKDAWNAAIATTATTGVDPNSFKVTFSGVMDESTILAATAGTTGNITLTCGAGNVAIPVTVAVEGTTANTYTVTAAATDMYKYQLLNCTLAFSANIKNSSGTAITAATYTFTNACATTDLFDADTLDFTAGATTGNCYDYWSTGLSTNYATSFTITDGIFRYTAPNADIYGIGDRAIGVMKNFSSDSLTIIVEMKQYGTGGNTARDFCSISLEPDYNNMLNYVALAVIDDTGLPRCKTFSYVDGAEASFINANCSTPTDAAPVYLKVVKDGTNFKTYYGLSADSFSGEQTFTNSSFTSGGTYYLNIACSSITVGWTQDIGYIEITGGTATGPGSQY